MDYQVPECIEELTTADLRTAIEQLTYSTWEEDALIRTLASRVYGDDYIVTHILMLATPLAVELERRTRTVEFID